MLELRTQLQAKVADCIAHTGNIFIIFRVSALLRKMIASAIASSGIIVQLFWIVAGRTAHSALKLPLNVENHKYSIEETNIFLVAQSICCPMIFNLDSTNSILRSISVDKLHACHKFLVSWRNAQKFTLNIRTTITR